MIESICSTIRRSRVPPIPKDIFVLGKIKALVSGEFKKLRIARTFKPKLYDIAEYVYPVLYALSSSLSIHQACEELNDHFSALAERMTGCSIKRYADGVRRRRMIPHQTSVDRFLNRMGERDAQQFFRNILAAVNSKIRNKEISTSGVKFLADNTKYPYYGAMKTDTEIGAQGLPGTRRCRMFQGHSVYGCGLHLFTQFNVIKKGQYRAAPIFESVQWLRWQGFQLSYALVDREFYRASLIRDLKRLRLPVIIPVKKFRRVRLEMKEFLRKHRPLVDQYLFTQSSNQYPKQRSAMVNLVFIGRSGESAHGVRDRYYTNKILINDMIKQMAGFFTTLKPWKNVKSFARFLTRTYKQRWNIETGFRELNSTHPPFRNRKPAKQCSQMYLKAIIYNNWQLWRKRELRNAVSFSDGGKVLYLRLYNAAVKNLIDGHIDEKLKMVLKDKKEVYFA